MAMPETRSLLHQSVLHEPVTRARTGYEYPNGVRDPSSAHTLTMFDCTCGYKGAVWYASEARARQSWERHLHA